MLEEIDAEFERPFDEGTVRLRAATTDARRDPARRSSCSPGRCATPEGRCGRACRISSARLPSSVAQRRDASRDSCSRFARAAVAFRACGTACCPRRATARFRLFRARFFVSRCGLQSRLRTRSTRILSPPDARFRRDATASAISKILIEDGWRDILPRHLALATQHRQQPFRVGVLAPADVETEPRRTALEIGARGASASPPFGAGARETVRRRDPRRLPARAIAPRRRTSAAASCSRFASPAAGARVSRCSALGLVENGSRSSRSRPVLAHRRPSAAAPDRLRRRPRKRRSARLRARRNEDGADAPEAGAGWCGRCDAAGFRVVRQFGMYDEAEIGQIDPARRLRRSPTPSLARPSRKACMAWLRSVLAQFPEQQRSQIRARAASPACGECGFACSQKTIAVCAATWRRRLTTAYLVSWRDAERRDSLCRRGALVAGDPMRRASCW